MLNNTYNILELIGEGNFGKIYKGSNKLTNELVAIKVEPIQKQLKLLLNESKIYYLLKNTEGIPILKWFGKDNNNYYLITELLGFSLNDVLNHSLTLSIIIELSIQMLQRIESFHTIGLIHRDIKPDNFLFGLNDNKNKLYLIDYGLSKSYIKNDVHISYDKNKNIIGTPNYISLHIHNNSTASRRDDIESWIYVMMELMNINTWKIYDYYKTPELFIQTKTNCISQNIPAFIKELLIYTRNLSFTDTPNYELLYTILSNNIL